MKKFALIVAGGSGNRMKTEIPKQFIEIAGKPILMHTLLNFKNFDPEIYIVLVLPKNQLSDWKFLCQKFSFDLKYELAFGGETRFQSVKNGLDKINENGIVFIHDGVRPLVSHQTILNCYQTAKEKGNALPVIPVTDSLRFANNKENKTVAREHFFRVQTPQTFQIQKIKAAYKNASSTQFTDDASVLEETGEKINLVEGNRENIKITYPEDLIISEIFIQNLSS